jgi:hypothetical protein
MRDRLELKMDVLGSDEGFVGEIKEIRTDDILIDRVLRRDIYVPFGAITSIRADEVTLAFTAAEVDRMEWEMPPLLGSDPTGDAAKEIGELPFGAVS